MIHAAWPNHVFVEPRSVEAHIVRLRKALNERGEAGLIRSASSGAYSRQVNRPGIPTHATTRSGTFSLMGRSS
jgi:hypothetical protein